MSVCFKGILFLNPDLKKITCRGQVTICVDPNLMGPPEVFAGLDFPAVAFKLTPYSLPDYDNGHHKGYEYDIAAAITGALGLNMVVRPPSTGGKWGWQEENGNYTGNAMLT